MGKGLGASDFLGPLCIWNDNDGAVPNGTLMCICFLTRNILALNYCFLSGID